MNKEKEKREREEEKRVRESEGKNAKLNPDETEVRRKELIEEIKNKLMRKEEELLLCCERFDLTCPRSLINFVSKLLSPCF